MLRRVVIAVLVAIWILRYGSLVIVSIVGPAIVLDCPLYGYSFVRQRNVSAPSRRLSSGPPLFLNTFTILKTNRI
ncbi:unnamed protein product [Haemonchus placei]|uniref:Uncharacterized protein n=1 Tax=Haemonchus placei TaxID=6290 RepID=A0A3P7XZF8_HAEPC|nr:unnamed protein product [Haemonchus placei]